MKLFRPALAGILPAFALLVCAQLNARAASIPASPDMQSWFTGDDTATDHIWLRIGTLYNAAAFTRPRVALPSQSRQLLFEDRVAYQRAIEEVYWRHRIWPKERPDRKPSLDAVMSQATIEQKVQDYLRVSELLEGEWQKQIAPEQLQAEMDRMAEHTKQPEVLRELFAALGNDSFVIAECLARPVLSERLESNFNAYDQTLQSELRERAEADVQAENQMPKLMAAASGSYVLPTIPDGPNGCIDDTWTPTSLTSAPTFRNGRVGVWTGSEMIIWGGYPGFVKSGGRYNPSTDSWTTTSFINVPTGRSGHSVIWTGSEMIVWGGDPGDGSGRLNTGGRYNPITDSWIATSTTNAPSARSNHTAVWTGSEMIVWGGYYNSNLGLNTGGRYNPSTDSWIATSTTNAPAARASNYTAVWTGRDMVVWGGETITGRLNTGGRYNASTDKWIATSTTNAPEPRASHSAVWTGSEMIVWGGSDPNFTPLNTGGRYDPATNTWTATSTTNAPEPRASHSAVWTGSEMVVWGGSNLGTGGRYDPSTDGWTGTNTAGAPHFRGFFTSIWTGSEMIIWGGSYSVCEMNCVIIYLNSGGRYCAQSGSPTITLSAKKKNVGGINTVRLTWDGATSTDIDVYRDGVVVATTPNDGQYDDSTGDAGRAQYIDRVCEAGTETCSNDVTVRFQR